MSKRQQLKVFAYALVYFLETDEVGIVQRRHICEGYQTRIRKNAYVKVNWNKCEYNARIIDVAGKFYLIS